MRTGWGPGRNSERERQIYFMELVHVILGLGSPNSAGQTFRLVTQGSFLYFKSWRQSGGRIPCFLMYLRLFLLRLNCFDEPTHIMQDNLPYSKSTDVNVNLIQNNTFTLASRVVFNQISGYPGLAKLTHKKNHHKWFQFQTEIQDHTASFKRSRE